MRWKDHHQWCAGYQRTLLALSGEGASVTGSLMTTAVVPPMLPFASGASDLTVGFCASAAAGGSAFTAEACAGTTGSLLMMTAATSELICRRQQSLSVLGHSHAESEMVRAVISQITPLDDHGMRGMSTLCWISGQHMQSA